MAHRHKVHHAKGGKVFYTGAGSHVAHEATDPHSHKHGGRAKHHKKDGGAVAGYKSGGRLDKRARGGGVGVGADKSPFSSAHIKSAHGHQHNRGGAVKK